MADYVHLDITPIAAPVFVQRVRDSDLSGGTYPEKPRSTGITSLGNVYAFNKSGDPPSGRSSWNMVGTAINVYPPVESGAQAERVAADRVRMLAAQYEGNASAQDLARLEILTARLSRLAPRTTVADIAKVEKTVDLLEEINASLNALAAEYDN